MKNTTKRLFSLVLTVVMMMGFALSSSAAGIITYEGKAGEESYTFAPGTEYSVSDLFTDFKNLMPGDKINQTIRLVNNGKDGTTTKFYLKALGPASAENPDLLISNGQEAVLPEEPMPSADDVTEGAVILGNGDDTDGNPDRVLDSSVQKNLLNQLKMTVEIVKTNGNETIFEAPADQTAGLSDWVLLGSLRKGGEIDLEVTIEVPAEMGNEFRDLAGALEWAVKIEEIPDPTPVVPDTGDNTGAMMYAAMFGVAAMALIVIIILKKRKTEE